jgi:integrase
MFRAPHLATGGFTVGRWLAFWLSERSDLAESTRSSYAKHIRQYFAPRLGSILLADLSRQDVRAMFTAIVRSHAAAGRPLTAATLVRIRATLSVALNAAVRDGLINDNPASSVQLPRVARPHGVVWTQNRVAEWQATGARPPVAVWTAVQTAAFLQAILGHRLYAAYHLMALRGLRRGETCGLRWCDVDLDEGVLTVRQQLQQYEGRLVVVPPKTPTSVRIVALDHTTVAALRRHQSFQQRELGTDRLGCPTGFVFTNPHGEPVKPDFLTGTFRRLVEAAGLPPVRLHDLRHGAATLALAAGNDMKIIQDQQGHSTYYLTADTYTSVLPEVAKRAAEDTARFLEQAARRNRHIIRYGTTRPLRPRTPSASTSQPPKHRSATKRRAIMPEMPDIIVALHRPHTRSSWASRIGIRPGQRRWAARGSNPEPTD